MQASALKSFSDNEIDYLVSVIANYPTQNTVASSILFLDHATQDKLLRTLRLHVNHKKYEEFFVKATCIK